MNNNNFLLNLKSKKTEEEVPELKIYTPERTYYTPEELELQKKWKEHDKRGRFVELPFTGIILEFLIMFITSPAIFMASGKIYMLECAIIPYLTSALTHKTLASELMWEDMTTFWVEFILLYLLNITLQAISYITRLLNVLIGSAGIAFGLVMLYIHFIEKTSISTPSDINVLHWIAMGILFIIILIKQMKKQDLTGELG